ncbi:MAG: VOC family protein [Mesorhizobium sp.]
MTKTTPERSHPLDHLVLPTADLAVARARLTALGFTVAPRGVHPFGTDNCCVYFSDGTFMEPLAIADAGTAAEAIAAGNTFVARDRAYRDRLGEEGFSAVVFGTSNADVDHTRYVEAGISAGNRLDFSRPFIDAAGNSDTASFRLAFAAAVDAPESFLFSCERVNAPKVDRTSLQAHANGVAGLAEIVAVSSNPPAQHDLLRTAANLDGKDSAAEGRLTLANASITVLDAAAFEKRFGISPGAPSYLRFAVVVFSVADIAALRKLLAANGIDPHLRGDSVMVLPAPGQGAVFVFKEIA